MPASGVVTGSFRDPSGFLFFRDGRLLRQVNLSYKDDYEHLMGSGLYEALAEHDLLVRHEEVDLRDASCEGAYKVIQPEVIPFISYPYEWSFSQLKVAALATLRIQKTCHAFGMSLKDSSAYNIQFSNGKPVLIDTLSFERYREGYPWVAYRQFCQHFLAPLTLMGYRDVRLSQLLRVHLDGIPLDMASALCPFRTRLVFPLLCHIHLHARSQKHFAGKAVDTRRHRMSRLALSALVDSLERAVRRLAWRPRGTEWGDYYAATNYSTAALEHKQQVVSAFLDRIKPSSVWDLGANTGLFSRIASDKGIPTVAFDNDPAAVEIAQQECMKSGRTNLLPLLVDLTNPSPAIGWANEERLSLARRGPADTVMALALIHHLAISNNLPLGRIADFLSRICTSLIIEFVPKDDSQVQRLLATREDVFPHYTRQAFETEFGKLFSILSSTEIKDSKRPVYLMVRRERGT